MRIDAHQHFWNYDAAEYGWIADNGLDALARSFGPRDLRPLLDAKGIDGCIAVQARGTLGESRWLLELAHGNPWILGVVGWADLVSPELSADLDGLEELSRCSEDPSGDRSGSRLVGLRHVVQDEADGFLDQEIFRRGVREVGRRGLTYDVLVFARQMAEAVRFCEALPGQRFVLDHIGKPEIAKGRLDGWLEPLKELGRMDHVSVKLSGLVTEADHVGWTDDDLRPFLDATLEAFGPSRLMAGSDWPVCTLAATHGETFRLLEDWAAPLTDSERASLFGGAAEAAYRLPRPE